MGRLEKVDLFKGLRRGDLSLTTGMDFKEGGAGDDTFLATDDGTDATLTVGDELKGGLGQDTLKVLTGGSSVELEGVTLSSVEHVTIKDLIGSLTTVDIDSNDFQTLKITTHANTNADFQNVDSETAITVDFATQERSSDQYSELDFTFDSKAESVNINHTVNFAATSGDGDDQYVYFNHELINATKVDANISLNGGISDGVNSDYAESYTDLNVGGADAVVNVDFSSTGWTYTNEDSDWEAWQGVDVFHDGSGIVNANITLKDAANVAVEFDADGNGSMSEQVANEANIVLDNVTMSEASDESGIWLYGGFSSINIEVVNDSAMAWFESYDAAFDYESQDITIKASADLSVGWFDAADEGDNTLTITGAGNVTLESYNGADTDLIDASKLTGDFNLSFDYSGEATVISGSGDDTIEFSDSLSLNPDGDAFASTFNGGQGFDTFTIDAGYASDTEANLNADVEDITGAVMNFERLVLTGVDGDDVDATLWGLADDVSIDGNVSTTGGSLTVNDLANLEVTGSITGDFEFIVDGAADGNDNRLSFRINGADGISLTAVTVSDVETIDLLSIASDADDTTPGNNNLELVAAETVALVISGTTALNLDQSSADFTALESVDAEDFDAGLTLNVSTSVEAVTITVGDGANMIIGSDQDDVIAVGNGGNSVTGGLGADQINLGSGVTEDGVDTIIYVDAGDSQGLTVDVIDGFQVAVQSTDDMNSDDAIDEDDVINDVLDFSALNLGTGSYIGEANGYGAVLTALSGGDDDTKAVFDTSDNTLYVDVDGSGTLDSLDLAIKLNGVTSLSADNFAFA